jgi:hypothetical protein
LAAHLSAGQVLLSQESIRSCLEDLVRRQAGRPDIAQIGADRPAAASPVHLQASISGPNLAGRSDDLLPESTQTVAY